MTEKNIKTNIEVTDNGKEIAAIDAIPPIAPATIAARIGNLVMKAVKKEDAKIGLHGKVN